MTAKFNHGLGEVRVECDKCGEEDSFSGDDFSDAMATAKMSGWKNVKVGALWENHCPDCAKPRSDFA